MAYPTTIDSFTNPSSSDTLDSPDHAEQHSNANDAIEALEAKVGANSSTEASSLDYKLTNADSSNPGHKHTLANAATDVTSSAAEVNKTHGLTGGIVDIGGAQTITGDKTLPDGYGAIVPDPAICIVRVGASGETSIANASYQTIAFAQEIYDPQDMHEGVTNPSRITVPYDGYYMITWSAAILANATGVRGGRVLLDGSVQNHGNVLVPTAGAGLATRIDGTLMYYLAASSYIELALYQDSGGPLDASNVGVWLEAALLYRTA